MGRCRAYRRFSATCLLADDQPARTFVQDHSASSTNPLATHGRTIHWVKIRPAYRLLILLRHKLRRERPVVFAPQHGQRDRIATRLAMSRRRKVEIELGT